MLPATLSDLLQRCDDALGVVLMGFDRSAVEIRCRDTALEAMALGVELSSLLSQVHRVAEVLEVGRLEELVVRSEEITVLLRVITDRYFVGLMIAPSGHIGKARFLMRVALPGLRARLG